MSNNAQFAQDEVLLKIYRNYSQDEAITYLKAQLAAEKFRVGELSSELAEAKDTLAKYSTEAREVKEQIRREEVCRQLNAQLTAKGQRIKNLKEQVERWQARYFDLERKYNQLISEQNPEPSVATDAQ